MSIVKSKAAIILTNNLVPHLENGHEWNFGLINLDTVAKRADEIELPDFLIEKHGSTSVVKFIVDGLARRERTKDHAAGLFSLITKNALPYGSEHIIDARLTNSGIYLYEPSVAYDFTITAKVAVGAHAQYYQQMADSFL